MIRPCKTVSLIAFVALLCAGPAFTQAPPTEEASKAAGSAATEAYVYVQTHQGVNVYDATAAGKLTLVKGSPFATIGQMGGINGKYLISVGTDYLRTYPIEPSGAVGKQVFEIDTQDYAGGECGPTGVAGQSYGALLDHKGKYFYVQLYGNIDESTGYALCSAWQTYQILSNGSMEFMGDAEVTGDESYHADVALNPIAALSSDDLHAFGICYCFPYAQSPFELYGPDHILSYINFKETDPQTNPAWVGGYDPETFAADPTNHLAAIVDLPFGGNNVQLASYTIDNATGSITSSNTYANMPPVEMSANLLSISISGKFLAVGQGPGLQLFHFNGAAPITTYSSLLLPTINIDQLAWDNDNHLYALSYESNELYVFTVTPTTISQATGSPYSIPNAYGIKGLIVVPKL
jgi:hypothetical protein